MKTQHKYDGLRSKMEQMPRADVNALWSNMEKILDAEMPVQHFKRPASAFRVSPYSLTAFVAVTAITALLINKTLNTSSEQALVTTEQAKSLSGDNSTTINNNNQNIINNKSNSVLDLNNTNYPNTALYINNRQEPRILKNSILQDVVVNATENNANEYSSIAQQSMSPIASGFNGISNEVNISGKSATPFLGMKPAYRKETWLNKVVAGVSFNYTAAINGQELNHYTGGSKNASLYDYLPSIYAQYHFNKQLYVQAEAQITSPQYTSKALIYNRMTDLNPDEKEQDLNRVDKLYYMNVPVTVNYTPTPHVTVGAGVQYSKLKQMVISNEQYYSVKSGSSWNTTQTAASTEMRAVPGAEAKSSMVTSMDSVAQSFKKTDMRLVLEAGYNISRFNIGVKYTAGLSKPQDGSMSTNIIPAARNQSLQLSLKVNLWDKRKF